MKRKKNDGSSHLAEGDGNQANRTDITGTFYMNSRCNLFQENSRGCKSNITF